MFCISIASMVIWTCSYKTQVIHIDSEKCVWRENTIKYKILQVLRVMIYALLMLKITHMQLQWSFKFWNLNRLFYFNDLCLTPLVVLRVILWASCMSLVLLLKSPCVKAPAIKFYNGLLIKAYFLYDYKTWLLVNASIILQSMFGIYIYIIFPLV